MKEYQARGITLFDLSLYCKAWVAKILLYWHKNKHLDQWNKAQSQELNPHINGQLIYDKGNKNKQWGKHGLLNKRCGKNWTATYKSMKIDHGLIPYTEINSKWIKDTNIKPETMKPLEENTGAKVLDRSYWCFLLIRHQKQKQKIKISKQNCIRLKNLCAAKETINKMKWYPTERDMKIIYLIRD